MTVQSYTFEVLPVAKGSEIQPLHMQASGLQASPKGTGRHTTPFSRASEVGDTLTILEQERVENMTCCLFVSLLPCVRMHMGREMRSNVRKG